jgi:hypothetical protein
MKNLFLIAAVFTVSVYASDKSAEKITIMVKKPLPKDFIGESAGESLQTSFQSKTTPAQACESLKYMHGAFAGILVITDEKNMARDVSAVTSCALKQLCYYNGTPVNNIYFFSEPIGTYLKYNPSEYKS